MGLGVCCFHSVAAGLESCNMSSHEDSSFKDVDSIYCVDSCHIDSAEVKKRVDVVVAATSKFLVLKQ